MSARPDVCFPAPDKLTVQPDRPGFLSGPLPDRLPGPESLLSCPFGVCTIHRKLRFGEFPAPLSSCGAIRSSGIAWLTGADRGCLARIRQRCCSVSTFVPSRNTWSLVLGESGPEKSTRSPVVANWNSPACRRQRRKESLVCTTAVVYHIPTGSGCRVLDLVNQVRSAMGSCRANSFACVTEMKAVIGSRSTATLPDREGARQCIHSRNF